MREIKFRYHYLVKEELDAHDGEPYGIWSQEMPTCSLGYVIESDDYGVGQYTGLKDKNGVEIYEGDILRIGSSLIEEVKWVGVGDWVGAKQPMVGFISHETIYRKPIEVIGNIYENPELLEQTNDQL